MPAGAADGLGAKGMGGAVTDARNAGGSEGAWGLSLSDQSCLAKASRCRGLRRGPGWGGQHAHSVLVLAGSLGSRLDPSRTAHYSMDF